MNMIIDMSILRKKSNSLINDVIFEYKMKRGKRHNGAGGVSLYGLGFIFMFNETNLSGIYSYEMLSYARASGDFLSAFTFGLLPVLQGFDINNMKALDTYVKDRLLA